MCNALGILKIGEIKLSGEGTFVVCLAVYVIAYSLSFTLYVQIQSISHYSVYQIVIL